MAEVNPENEGCLLETETIKVSVHAKMASEVLGTPGDKRALESKEISGTDEVTDAMQILRLRESKRFRIWMKLCRLMNY